VPTLAGTPPKGDDSVSGPKNSDAGNLANAVGSTKRTIDPIRSGISETGWLDALRRVQVTELQATSITRTVRTYLDQSEVWKLSMGLELDLVVVEIRRIRDAGGDIPPELSTRVRMIRGSMPKWGATQRRIISELTPTQVESLLLEIDRVKLKQREQRQAEVRRRAMEKMEKMEKTGPSGEAGRTTMIEPPATDSASVPPKPWSFVQSEKATPTESTDQAEAPAKTDVPEKTDG
jgi:hypothetical protein